MNKDRVGFIGLGNMGGRMTRRLVGAGIAVSGYDTDASRAAAVGARAAVAVCDVVGDADVVLLSLPDSRAVESVVAGDGGVLASSRAGQMRPVPPGVCTPACASVACTISTPVFPVVPQQRNRAR